MAMLAALGLELVKPALCFKTATLPAAKKHRLRTCAGWIPARIRLADYPQLRSLAWHVQGIDTLTPTEALDIYERNARHLDALRLASAHEQDLLDIAAPGFVEGGYRGQARCLSGPTTSASRMY